MYFPDRGCVRTLLTLYVYATGLVAVSDHFEHVETFRACRRAARSLYKLSSTNQFALVRSSWLRLM